MHFVTKTSRVNFLAIVFAMGWLGPAPCRGEFFFDLSAGAAYTLSTDVDGKDKTFFPSLRASEDVDFDTSFSMSLRFGHYLYDVPWLGFAMDFSFFTAEGDVIEDNYVWSFTPMIMFRAPLITSRDYPHGRLQPYLGVGPGFFVSDASVDLRPELSEKISDAPLAVGLDARAGVTWLFTPYIATYVEYRFTYFEPEWDERVYSFFGSSTIAEAEAELATHHVLLGVSLRW